ESVWTTSASTMSPSTPYHPCVGKCRQSDSTADLLSPGRHSPALFATPDPSLRQRIPILDIPDYEERSRSKPKRQSNRSRHRDFVEVAPWSYFHCVCFVSEHRPPARSSRDTRIEQTDTSWSWAACKRVTITALIRFSSS